MRLIPSTVIKTRFTLGKRMPSALCGIQFSFIAGYQRSQDKALLTPRKTLLPLFLGCRIKFRLHHLPIVNLWQPVPLVGQDPAHEACSQLIILQLMHPRRSRLWAAATEPAWKSQPPQWESAWFPLQFYRRSRGTVVAPTRWHDGGVVKLKPEAIRETRLDHDPWSSHCRPNSWGVKGFPHR